MRRAPNETSGWPTRERILLHASRAFAAQGFRGTSTRDIARAVGISQPTVYSHFVSKQAIAEELVRRDLNLGIAALARLADEGGGPAVELYRYLVWEVNHVASTPFDLRALYFNDIGDLPTFAEGRRLTDRYNELLESIIDRGSRSGAFRPIDVVFARQAIDAIVLETIRGAAQRRGNRLLAEPHEAASFVVRALLTRAGDLERVRRRAERLGPPQVPIAVGETTAPALSSDSRASGATAGGRSRRPHPERPAR